MRKKEQDKNIVEIKEDVKIGDYILEAGDKVKVLKESSGPMIDYAVAMVEDIFGGDYEKAFIEVIIGMSDDEVKESVDYIYRMWQ